MRHLTRVKKKSENIIYKLSLLTLFVCLAFPKAGWYINNIPINVGYILLTLSSSFIFFHLISDPIRKNIKLFEVLSFFLVILLTVYISFIFVQNGYANKTVPLSILVSICVVPIMMLMTMGYVIRNDNGYLSKILYISFLIVVTIGIANFILMNFFHKIFYIPYVTLTGNDPDILFQKCNSRSFIFKASATYNNGNILGINALMWFPLVIFCFRPNFVNKLLGRILFFLTFSRTVFVGWFMLEILHFFRKYRLLFSIIFAFTIFVVLAGAMVIIKDKMPWLNFLFDPRLGGRISQLHILTNFYILPIKQAKGLQEIVYSSFLDNFGLVGLILFMLTFFSPLCVYTKNHFQKICKICIIIYLFVMCSDGAFILVPTQAIFWMLVSLLYYPELVTKFTINNGAI